MVNTPDRKLYRFGKEAQDKIAEGIKKGVEVVASTLGPAGRLVLLERKYRTPTPIDDGYSAINNLILEDELENLGVSSLVDAANKASEYAKDGTSTTIVLVGAIYEEGRKLIGDLGFGKTPYEIRKEILEAKDVVVKKLIKSAKEVKTTEDIKSVALAAYADEDMANVVSDMLHKVGENGVIIVEEGWGRETETEILTGMKFAGKLAHGFFANTPEEGLSLEGLPILVSDFDFVNLNELSALITDLSKEGGHGIIVMANKYERTAIEQIIRTNTFNIQQRNPFRIYLTRTPSFTSGEFEDFATFVGARYFSKETGDKINEAQVSDLGQASVFKISKSGEGIVIGGNGRKEDIDNRIKDLKQKLADEKVKLIKARTEQRIASLASAIGIIKVASPSEGETENIRLKTKNAVGSAQAAVKEGMVKGGGLALKEIADSLPEGNILKKALKAPYEAIQKNGGGKVEIPDIYDALKVIRTAVEQACSQAWMLINTGTVVAFRTERGMDDAAETIARGLGKGSNKKDEY